MSSGIAFPTLNFNSFNVFEFDPGNARHVVSGSFAYDRLLGINECLTTLDFGTLTLNIGDSQIASNVVPVNFAFPDLETLAAQSGVPTVINNFKLWLPNGSGALLDNPNGRLEVVTSGEWVRGFAFPSGGGEVLPSILPTVQNIFRLDGHHSISGYKASEVSQYIYFRLFLGADFPTGTFGGNGACGSGILRPRLTYDFY